MALKINFFILTLLFGFFTEGKSESTQVVYTDKGPVKGEILTTVENSFRFAAFKGIPYAEPPLGNLRFKPPIEKQAWSNVLSATTEGSMCIQYNSTANTVVGSEDCLYLNVFTPHTEFNNAKLKPVMVWIYGGAFMTGNSNLSYYGPDFLLEEDVVVVSLNYRLGALGFLNLNHEHATGNCGLKDQNLALKWVQKNIANFGGDPKKVTIFGQSAGSVAVDLHVLSDMSSGLFSQSISMSGAPLCLYWGFQTTLKAQEQAFALGSKLGIVTLSKDTLLKNLYKVSAFDIVNKTHDIPLFPFRPTIESVLVAKDQKKFLTKCSLQKYAFGNYNKGPHMMGFVSDEILSFAKPVSNLVDLVNAGLDSIKKAALNINIPFFSNISRIAASGVSNFSDDIVYQLIKDLTDLFFITGIDSKQKLMSVNNNHPIYYYRYSFNSEYSMHRAIGVNFDGVGHGDELPYLFYMPQINLPLNNPEIALTRKRMVRLWANFAKYGHPTPNGAKDDLLGITWPDSRILGRHLEFNNILTTDGTRPTDLTTKTFEVSGLGASPILNDCPKNAISNVINSITDIIG